ncbi:GPP34 family phosphoprotein [Saccharopolyspora gloriosae]|uniref:GOLPH3/VPS74 family protein n=1 Tax=Saccharopolyspora gloriosae TaxID=455344 RepID=UPI001FB57C4F|nr:GPP34 family phosphoprotein [Saccharopolyspora gloriosae]
MNQPLPHQMYLLCYDTEKGKIESSSALVRGQLMRAAAVADLALSGWLRDRDGKAERTTTKAPDDPFLAEVLNYLSPDRPRRWFNVVDHNWHTAEATVRDLLDSTGVITADRRRALGLFPVHDIVLPDPERGRVLRERVRGAVLGGHDPAGIAIEDAALATFALQGDVRTVFSPRERRAHREVVRAVADRVDVALPRLRKALDYSIAARRAGATS